MPTPSHNSVDLLNQLDEINFCVYTKSAKDARIPPFYKRKSFLKSAAIFIIVFMLAFIAGLYLMKMILGQIDSQLSGHLNTEQHTIKSDNASPFIQQMQKRLDPAQTEFDTELPDN